MTKIDLLKINIDSTDLTVKHVEIPEGIERLIEMVPKPNVYEYLWILLRLKLEGRSTIPFDAMKSDTLDRATRLIEKIARMDECKNIAKLMVELENEVADFEEDTVKISKEQVKEIFNYGSSYSMAQLKNTKFSVPFPIDDYDAAIDYVYRHVIEGERDPECLDCGRYHSKSCNGTINRGRKEITKGNRCGAYYKYETP